MFLRKKVEEKIAKKQEEIASMEKQIGEARAYMSALQDTLKLFPKHDAESAKPPVLRPGSDLAKTRELLLKNGKPMHVAELLKGIGKEVNKSTRVSLGGSLSGYVRRGLIFTKPQPNTFGLMELETQDSHDGDGYNGSAPPENFGLE